MTKRTRGQIGTDVSEIAQAARRAASPVPRALDDMEQLSRPGAREIATLTVIARSQDWQFEPLMRALEAASRIEDWSHSFMVAQPVTGDGSVGPRFNWRDAPYRRYASFKDFYTQELEATWGKWENLQHTWARIVRGEITEAEGRALVNQRVAARSQAAQRPVGTNQYSEEVYDNQNGIHRHKAKKGTSAETAERRLRRDRPDLHARVMVGELSWNAAAIEAGFRKKRSRKKLTILDRILKLVPGLTADERAQLVEHLSQPRDGIIS